MPELSHIDPRSEGAAIHPAAANKTRDRRHTVP
jgi:hypothetical protein